jgi:hypothetical protein
MDTKKKKFYIGSHKGDINDGYIGSGQYFKYAYTKRPEDFKRRILEFVNFEDLKELHKAEQRWLSMIKNEELGCKYYNLKKCAAGGNIIKLLSHEKQIQHKEKSIQVRRLGWIKWYNSLTPEQRTLRAKYANSSIKQRSGGSMPGVLNPFYGKKHCENTRKLMSEKAKGRTNNIKKYKIVFPNGFSEIFLGCQSIADKYNTEYSIKFINFIDTDIPIRSNRKSALNHPLIGAKIYRI